MTDRIGSRELIAAVASGLIGPAEAKRLLRRPRAKQIEAIHAIISETRKVEEAKPAPGTALRDVSIAELNKVRVRHSESGSESVDALAAADALEQ